MMNIGTLNLRWARILIDQLILQGVDYFCVSPGSRSTPLAIAIAEHPDARALVHFDERGTAFHALGYAKSTNKATAILVTSGTAVGNLLPALMEAYNERVPLVVLTADRPPELRDCGASQTCDQVKLFTPYVRYECDLPCPTEEIPERFLATTVAHAVYQAHGFPSGPVHINCMFRKPLFAEDHGIIPHVIPLRIEPGARLPTDESLKACSERIQGCKEGLILVGSLASGQEIAPILALAEKLGWPVVTDILSQVRTLGKHPCLIRYFETLLRTGAEHKPKMVIHFGDRIVSKVLKYWLAELALEEYIQVSDHPHRQDPHHQVTWRFTCSPALFCKGIRVTEMQAPSPWLHAWQRRAERIENCLDSLFDKQTELTEPGVVRELEAQLGTECSLFIANSMPIRDTDLFLFPDQPIGSLFGNRGVAGIDGNIATAVGIAAGKKQPVIALLGDLTTLHDLNSLAQIKESPFPVLIVVINNHGGGIFSFLPVAEKTHLFDTFVATAHPYSFQGAAELFQLPYHKIESQDAWAETLSSFMTHPASGIIEIQTERAANYQFHQEITRRALRARIGYCTAGNPRAPALVFIHGFMGCRDDWQEIMNLMSADYFCIAFDLPGHGETPFTPDVCEEISTWMKSWDLISPTLIGYSMGGRIALQLKEKDSSFWHQVILLSTHPGLSSEEERAKRHADDLALSLKLESEPLSAFLASWYDQPLFTSLKNQPALFQSILERRLHNDSKALSLALTSYSLSALPSISSFAPNTAFLYGDQDLKYEAFYRILPSHVSVHQVPRAGHAIHVENPRSCAEILTTLLEMNHANTRS